MKLILQQYLNSNLNEVIVDRLEFGLVNKYNITIIFQIARSSYTNVLDLDVWMALQAAVLRENYITPCNANARVNSVTTTRNEG